MTLGIAAVVLPARDGVLVEVRLSPDEVEHAARLGAQAVLTAAFAEEGEAGAVVKLPIGFAAGSSGVKRFSVEKGSCASCRASRAGSQLVPRRAMSSLDMQPTGCI